MGLLVTMIMINFEHTFNYATDMIFPEKYLYIYDIIIAVFKQ